MSRTRSNLVPFDRSPDYWMMRAGKRKNDAQNSLAGFLYRQAFEQTKQSAIALRMAENYYQMGCYSAARRIAVELLQHDSSNAQAYYWLGMSALRTKDEELGEQALALALKKGRALPLADDIQDLLSDYPWTEPSTYRRSQRAWSHYQRALEELRGGDLLKVEMRLRLALRRGICPEAEALLGELLFYRKQYRQALKYLRRAAARITGQPSVWILQAQSCAAIGLHEQAASAFSKALSLTRTSREWGIAAAAASFMNCTDTVRKALKTALRNAPESNDLLYVLAATEANSGRVQEAVRCFNVILDRDPDDRDARLALCILGLGPVPFCRVTNDDALVDELCAEPPLRGDPALLRLIRGLTISMGGAASYQEVSGLAECLWQYLSPLQKRLCDRQSLWPNAFYLTLCRHFGINDLPEQAALWPFRRYKRRVQRMYRYLSGIIIRKGVDSHGGFQAL